MEAFIVGNKILSNNGSVRIDDLLDEDFYSYSDKRSKEFYNETYGVNEVYDHLIHHYFAIQRWIESNAPEILNVSKADERFKFYSKDICSSNNVSIKGVSALDRIKIWAIFHFSLLGSAIFFAYRFFLIPYKPGIAVSDRIAVVRTKAAIDRIFL